MAASIFQQGLLLVLSVWTIPSWGKPLRSQILSQWDIDFSEPKFHLDSNYTTDVNPATTFGVWEGWGTSLCWWANVFGDNSNLADLFFTLNYTSIVISDGTYSLPGLGLNIARYNAGGSAWRTLSDGSSMVVSPNIPAFKQIEGFWQDDDSSDPSSSSFDWSVDQNQISMLQMARDRGCNYLELFSNSPMWWQLDNFNPSGSEDGTEDNLALNHYNDLALYMSIVAKYANENWDVEFNSVESLNEPISDWWVADGTQEGCHFEHDTQADAVLLLRNALDNANLTDVAVAASDETYYDYALSTWEAFNATTQQAVGKVNVHGYQQGGGRRDLLYTAVNGKRLWNSEYGDGDGSGMSLVSNLNLDFKWLHNTAWVYWQMIDEADGWGMLKGDMNNGVLTGVNAKHYIMAQYSRHILPGMVIMETSGDDTVAAYDEARQVLVLVSTNYGVGRYMEHDLSSFSVVDGPASRWQTSPQDAAGDRYVKYDDVAISDKKITLWFDAYTTQTLQVEGVVV